MRKNPVHKSVHRVFVWNLLIREFMLESIFEAYFVWFLK